MRYPSAVIGKGKEKAIGALSVLVGRRGAPTEEFIKAADPFIKNKLRMVGSHVGLEGED